MLELPRLVRDLVANETARLRENVFDAVKGLILLLLAGLTGLVAVVFVLVGTYASLAEKLPSWQAGGIVALIALVVAGLVLLSSRSLLEGRRPAPPARPREDALADALRQATEHGREAGEALSRAGLTSLDVTLAAFVAGLVASRTTRPRPSPEEGAD